MQKKKGKNMLTNIEITKEELEYYKINHDNHGKESYIKYIDNHTKARKIFRENFGYDNLDIEKYDEFFEGIRENKLRKAIELSKIKVFENEVKLINTISCNKKFVGYDTVKPKGMRAVADYYLTRKEVAEYFKQIENKIEYFHSLGIVIGDITWFNVLLDKERKEVALCDLDNMQIGKYKIDILPSMIEPFCAGTCLMNQKIDAYMYNLMLMNELDSYYDGYQEIERALEGGYRPSYLEKRASKIIQRMIEASACGYYNGEYLTDYIKVKK